MSRRFELHRHEDISGVSGIGVVAEGIEFRDGPVAMRWLTEWPTSVVFHERGIESVEHIHGHGGATEVVWCDETVDGNFGVIVETLMWVFDYFVSMDESNAAIHTSPVKYSPVTFRVAQTLQTMKVDFEKLNGVLEHLGKYEEDKGR